MSFEEWWSEHGEQLWLADPDMLTRKDYARAAYEAGYDLARRDHLDALNELVQEAEEKK